jgi:catechol 2,3-dioxygenase-like lactoylglutathione lyase family enzyme
MPIASLDHCTIRTADLEAARRFYVDLLGLRVGDRPPFSFPGLWLYADDGRPVLHLVGVEPGRAQTGATGALDHVAFAASGAASFRARLAEAGIEFTERVVPLLDVLQLFIRDPHGIRVELNFPSEEA